MAGEERGTSTTGTSTPGIKPRGTEPAVVQSPQESLPYTKTPMTTTAPSKPPPPKYPTWITKKIDIFVLAGCPLDPIEELTAASQIWSKCYIEFKGIFHKPYDEAATRRLIRTNSGDDRKPVEELIVTVNFDETTASMQNLRDEWFKSRKGDMAAFFAAKVFAMPIGAKSAADPKHDIVYIGATENLVGETLAHELGHRLLNPAQHHQLQSPLMRLRGSQIIGQEIVELECRAARGDDKALFEIIRPSGQFNRTRR